MVDKVLYEFEDGDSIFVETWSNKKIFKTDWSKKLMISFTLWDHGGGVVGMEKDNVVELRDVLNKWLESQEGKPNDTE